MRKRSFENIVGKGGKGENAHNQHFSPFPTMFSTLLNKNFILFCRLKVPSIWTSLQICHFVELNLLNWLYHIILTFNNQVQGGFFENNHGKRRKCWKLTFSSLPTLFSTNQKINHHFSNNLFAICNCF